MQLVNGRLDYSYAGMSRYSAERTVFLFTGNSTIKRDGALVMGRGAALQIRDMYPGIDYAFGNAIRKRDALTYGIVWLKGPAVIRKRLSLEMPSLSDFNDPMGTEEIAYTNLWLTLGCFQVKHHFKDNADIKLIERSAYLLGSEAKMRPDLTFHMNYPGIGWGHLTASYVEPTLRNHLPDNVVLYQE